MRRYARGLLSALAGLGEGLEMVALGGSADTVPAGVEHVPEPWHPASNLGWAIVGLPRAAQRGGVDLLHAPAYTAPIWGTRPVVLTVHDVSYARHPEWYPYRRDALRRAFYRRSAQKAAAVITDSTFSATEIQAAYGLPDTRITVIPLGVDAAFTLEPPDAAATLPASVVPPYVLHVGDLHTRRNLPMLVEAVLAARRRPGVPALSLVLAGLDRGVAATLQAAADSAGVPGAVVHLGSVEEAHLTVLYRGAVALVYPSLYEGFGLPVLEAMACGTPVIASSAASMPEVLGRAGVLLDPADRTVWTMAIAELATDAEERARLGALGRARAAAFTWERTARATQAVYRRVHDA